MSAQLEITGLRGFAHKQTAHFSIPNGRKGSGVTIIVGANNSGKTTLLEAIRAMAVSNPPTFTQGRRNTKAGDKILIRLKDEQGGETQIETASGSSEAKRTIVGANKADIRKILVIPSKRVFDPYFGRSEISRRDLMENIGLPAQRTSAVQAFAYRLFTALKDKARFDAVLGKVMHPVPNWTIDQHDTGQHFVKITKPGVTHSSEGAGEGLVSLLFLVDALYDSNPGDTIVVDEPELSLHPSLQRKLARLFLEYSSDRQIILSTHSPYFADIESLGSGGSVLRVYQNENESLIGILQPATCLALAASFKDLNNPHVLGTNAKEIFFTQDQVILTEGQEDVIFLSKISADASYKLNGEFFGWGVGGASKMELIAQALKELGFQKVVGILDADKATICEHLKIQFPAFHFFCIPAQDVRTKSGKPATEPVIGLLDDMNEVVRLEHQLETQSRFAAANAYLGA